MPRLKGPELQKLRMEAICVDNANLQKRIADLEAAVGGLMEIAELAMPDSFFATDSRVKAARAALDTPPN